MTAPLASPSHRQKDHLAAAIVLAWAAYLVCVNVSCADLWGHVQYGRDVIADGHLHHETTYSYTAEGHRWINHELLSELLLATTVDTFGNHGLMIGKFLISLCVFGILLSRCRAHGLGYITSAAVVWLAAWNLSYFWSFRPQVLSFLFFTLLLWLLDYAFQGWSKYLHGETATDVIDSPAFDRRRLRALWCVPVILCLWTNSHGGFVAGTCVYLAYLGGRGLEALVFRRHAAVGLVSQLALLGFVAILGTLLNPYGADLHFWLISSLGIPRPEIVEWHPTELFSKVGTRMMLVSTLALTAIVCSRRKRDLTQIAILILLCWQSVKHVRHIPFIALAAAFWLPGPLAACLARLREALVLETAPPSTASSSPTANWCTRSVQAVLFGLALAGCINRLTDIHVVKAWFPVSAFQYIADQQVEGRMVVDFNWAQYAIGCFGPTDAKPRCPVAIDGRFRTCYPQEVIDMNFDFVLGNGGPEKRYRGSDSPPFDSQRVLHFKDPEIVVNRRNAPNAVATMEANRDRWTLLYQDQLAQVWGLKSKFGDPSSAHFIPAAARCITEAEQTGSKVWPALPDVSPNNPTHQIATGGHRSQPYRDSTATSLSPKSGL